MIYKLTLATSNLLLDKPETGMGYQIVEAFHSKGYLHERFVVYNGEIAINDDADYNKYKIEMKDLGYQETYKRADFIVLSDVSIIKSKEIKEIRSVSQDKITKFGRHQGGTAAIDNPKKNANGSDWYTRISHYENDKRINFEKNYLRPGSFTTLLRDYVICVQLNDDPIDRYALPSNDKIDWAFFIKPLDSDTVQEGIVQPAFGHDGGGEEAFFNEGTSPGTYKLKQRYGFLPT
jgi:hypothetical protein